MFIPHQSGSLTVFFPAYNDENTIGRLVQEANSLLPQLVAGYEIIVVNDGSTDGTARILADLAREIPCLRVIHHPVNLGYGAALRSGFAAATRDMIFYTDGDGQYDVGELHALTPLLADSMTVINGWKLKRADSFYRVMAGELYRQAARFFFGIPIFDVDCDFRLIPRHAIRQIQLESTSGVICIELIKKLHASGCRFVETPVRHYPRRYGRSQFFTLRGVGWTLFDFFRLWGRLVLRPAISSWAPRPASTTGPAATD
ncbi:MAG: glycosyltransferase family 2 protein [Blastocatellia bacterium]